MNLTRSRAVLAAAALSLALTGCADDPESAFTDSGDSFPDTVATPPPLPDSVDGEGEDVVEGGELERNVGEQEQDQGAEAEQE